ncbi:hypothetical protein Ancab_010468 [Ancistrocladus abbreviatus]
MSLPINNNQHQVASSALAAANSSSLRNNIIKTPLSLLPMSSTTAASTDDTKVEQDSDEDLFTVPDVEAQQAARPPVDGTKANEALQGIGLNSAKRRRGRNPVDKEHRRLKRLLRNRVSAQQARERKKLYVTDLESKANELQEKNFELEEKISTLLNENSMLRKILMNIRPKGDESVEPKHA